MSTMINYRDPSKVNFATPYMHGDKVKIDGKDWTVINQMDGWMLSTDGTWRGKHPRINGISAMVNLIRMINEATS